MADKNKTPSPSTQDDPSAPAAPTAATLAAPAEAPPPPPPVVVERFQCTSNGVRHTFELGPLTVPCDQLEYWVGKNHVQL